MKRCVVVVLIVGAVLLRLASSLLEVLDARIPECLEGIDLALAADVVTTSAAAQAGENDGAPLAQKLTAVVTAHAPACAEISGRRLRLSWYGPSRLQAPAHLVATVRLTRPWGMRNPAGFDYERWLLANAYAATGYVRELETYEIGQPPAAAAELRAATDAPGLVHQGLLRALVLGDKSAIDPATWALLRRTGTVHLMVVSGLHVSILGGAALAVCGLILRLVPSVNRCGPARVAPIVGALTVVWSYASMAGLAPPAMRASLMASAFLLMLCMDRAPAPWRFLAGAFVVVALVQPLQVLLQGFWLSFGAVACLVCFLQPRSGRLRGVRSLLGAQLALFIGMAPLLSLWTDEVPVGAPLANLIAVPIMSLAVVPLLFAGVTAHVLIDFDGIVRVTDFTVWAVVNLLGRVDALSLPTLGPRTLLAALACTAAAVVVAAPLSRAKRLGAVLVGVTLLLPSLARVPLGHFRVDVLDVGQGSAMLVSTTARRLLVDAGPSFASGFDTAQAVVIPTIRKTGRDQLDRFLVSHGDNDHAGGAPSIRTRYGAGTELLCGGDAWTWDDVRFSTLADPTAGTENARSCTLLVESATGERAYLSGDITRRTERRLMAELPRGVDLLVAPHHGSLTSSGWPFVKHLRPRVVVFTAARRNRYGHPRPEIVDRYRAVGARWAVTGAHGAVTWRSWRPAACVGLRAACAGR